MPISEYFGGHGKKVMASMKETYGKKKAKEVFYATANKKKMNPDDPGMKALSRKGK